MKTVFFLILFFLFSAQVKSQELSLDKININNVLQYLHNTEIQKQYDKTVTSVTQYGNQNFVEILDVKTDFVNIIQVGDSNSTFLHNQNLYPTNAEIRINGSGNYIDIQGSNSISYGMIMNINASDTTILMRNY